MDGADLPPPSPSVNSSSTPKKSWERQYKKFLRGPKFFPEKLSPPDLEKTDSEVPSRKLFGKHHYKHGSQAPRRSPPPKSPKQLKEPPDGGEQVTAKVQLPDLSSKSPKSKSVGFLHPNNSSKSSSKDEPAVRGGSLFGSILFKRDKSTPSLYGTEDESSGSGSQRHRHVDSLDLPIHKGKDVAYSPDNVRFKKTAAELPDYLMPRVMYNDLEGSVRGGVPQGALKQSPPQPQRLHSLLRQRQTQRNKSKEMKVAFTEFHNASEFAQDSTSAYLGDEPSHHGNDNFSALDKNGKRDSFCDTISLVRAYKDCCSHFRLPHCIRFLIIRVAMDTGHRSRYSESNLSLALSPVAEDVVPLKTSARVLSPLLGTETWSAGRRYLIAPAAVTMCPSQVLPVLSGNQKQVEEHVPRSFPVFGSLVLGTATVTNVGRSRSRSVESYGWSSCVFVLRQNYLLEYAQESSSIDDLPRGFAHLQHAVCQAHENFHDALHLQFYSSPCAKAGQRTVRVYLLESPNCFLFCVY